MRKLRWHVLCFRLLVLSTIVTSQSLTDPREKLRVVYSWKSLDFAFPSKVSREAAIITGRFKPGAAVPIDVDVYYGNNCLFFMIELF